MARKHDSFAAQALMVSLVLGLLLTMAVLLGIVGGSLLDARLRTSPLFLVGGSILGMACGISGAMRLGRLLAETLGLKKMPGRKQ